MKLVAGRTGQEYNLRKKRKGAFWEDRYHATAIESEEHLLKCLTYIDLNMVRNGVVSHPSEWSFCGYNEIQKPRKKNVLIAYQRLAELTGFESYTAFQETLCAAPYGAENRLMQHAWTLEQQAFYGCRSLVTTSPFNESSSLIICSRFSARSAMAKSPDSDKSLQLRGNTEFNLLPS